MRVNVNVPVVGPASVAVASVAATVITGRASSFWIVPVACRSAIVEWVAFDRLTTNVSFGSTTVSPSTVTATATLPWPAGIVAVPLAAV